ncbi:hypothetical protein CCUS01_12415 [Colletotrichum cuscutae]|uniref:Uncharacterized protein n=1 Tax=Colletotrichum cuscutae TaxID=1209917 RepID=A0AAI9TV68_9PEZI|nr:hypothetical protein CCUS01_12415 [Colletotrichum cuscutae]
MVGYDTSATTLSAVFYHVLRDPDHYQRIQVEVREAYSSISDITAQSVNVSADIWTIQRKPEYWALADKFWPDRWLGNGPGTVFEYDVRTSYRPFLVGPRVCIGREMALQSIRLTVAKVAFSFDLGMANKDTSVWREMQAMIMSGMAIMSW